MSATCRFTMGCLIGSLITSAAPMRAAETKRTVFEPAGRYVEKSLAPKTPSRLDQVEFRGVLSVAGETFITLVDTATSRALTIPLNQSAEDISVFDLQLEAGTVRARTAGQDRLLALREARIVAMAPPTPYRSVTHFRRDRPRDGSDRTSDVAREITRRRDMRRQLLEAGNSPNVSPAPAPDPSAANP